jgi:hypothetical protein
MHLYKNLRDAGQIKHIRSRDLKSFDFLHRMVDGKQDILIQRLLLSREEVDFHADLSAALVAQVFAARDANELFSAGLRCCRDILQGMGYKETTKDRFDGDVLMNAPNNDNTIVVFGCQNEPLLADRVTASISLARYLRKDVEVVFSGNAPNTDSVSILDESIRMSKMFEEIRDRLNLSEDERARIKRMRLFYEQRSIDTITNIEHLLKDDYLQQKRTYNLYLVSSTYHLVSIAEQIEKHLKTSRNIEQIILWGAELQNIPLRPPFKEIYIKQMFFYIFRYLMQHRT